MKNIYQLMLASLFIIFIAVGVCFPVNSAPQVFSSAYSDTDGKNCQMDFKPTKEDEGIDIPQTCRGVGGYKLHKNFSAVAVFMSVEGPGGFKLELNTDANKPLLFGKKIEWRMANGKPFACIIRVSVYSGEDDGMGNFFADRFKTGEFLLVRGLRGFEHIKHDVDVRGAKNANIMAQYMADEGYKK
jgi:hypothetical protein